MQKACGFDGVLVHGGYGFNIQQFISPGPTTGPMNSAKYGKPCPVSEMILEAVRGHWGRHDPGAACRLRTVDGGMEIRRDMVEFCREIDGMADIIHASNNGLKWAGEPDPDIFGFL